MILNGPNKGKGGSGRGWEIIQGVRVCLERTTLPLVRLEITHSEILTFTLKCIQKVTVAVAVQPSSPLSMRQGGKQDGERASCAWWLHHSLLYCQSCVPDTWDSRQHQSLGQHGKINMKPLCSSDVCVWRLILMQNRKCHSTCLFLRRERITVCFSSALISVYLPESICYSTWDSYNLICNMLQRHHYGLKYDYWSAARRIFLPEACVRSLMETQQYFACFFI